MKKGQKIEITKTAKYNGQDMDWTETFTGIKKIGKGGEWVVHHSDRLVKQFLPKEICVHPHEHSKGFFENTATKKEVTSRYYWKTYIYTIYLPEGMEVKTYSDDEYRFDLTEDMEIVFCGTVFEARLGVERKMTNRGFSEITKYIQYSDTTMKEKFI